MEKIKFKDLSGWLKFVIIASAVISIIAIYWCFRLDSLLAETLDIMLDMVETDKSMLELVKTLHNL